MAVGGTDVEYEYVQSVLCPAIKVAVASMFTDMDITQNLDWTWGNNAICKVRRPCVARGCAPATCMCCVCLRGMGGMAARGAVCKVRWQGVKSVGKVW